jgi:hypothetical protein
LGAAKTKCQQVQIHQNQTLLGCSVGYIASIDDWGVWQADSEDEGLSTCYTDFENPDAQACLDIS